MSSGARKDFDAWFSENYEELVKVAKTLHRDPRDLVHSSHGYISYAVFCLKKKN